MKKAFLHTLGCKLNQAETASAADLLGQAGYSINRNESDAADLIFINTCAVTDRAAAKSRHAIRHLARLHSGATLIAAGCLSKLDRERIAAMQGVSQVLGTAGDTLNEDWKVQLLEGTGNSVPSSFSVLTGLTWRRSQPLLKIEDGCDQNCSYCIIPSLRGKPRSEPLIALKDRAKKLVELGAMEIVLTGVRIGAWGKESREGSLVTLLRELSEVIGDCRIRLGSLEPWEISNELLDLVAHDPRICCHLHISLQHTDAAIIERMGRPPLDGTLERIANFAQSNPRVALGADVIAGFPGESAEIFDRHLQTLTALPFAYLHAFPFSPRPGTIAEHWKTTTPTNEVSARVNRLRRLSSFQTERFAKRQFGSSVSVISDHPRKGADWVAGITENYLRVLLPVDMAARKSHPIVYSSLHIPKPLSF